MSTQDADRLQRFHFEGTAARGTVVRLESSLAEVLAQHFYPDAVARLLGETLAASAMLSATLKFSGTLGLQARSSGAVSLLFGECSHDRQLRGYARVAEGAVGEGLGELLAHGTLAITITPDEGQRYQGIVPLEAPALAACLELYFEQSEQLPTTIWLASDGTRAAGLMLQALPERDPNSQNEVARWEHLNCLAATVRKEELLETPFETLLYHLFHEERVRIQTPEPVRFGCRCSAERAARTVKSIGETEARAVLAEVGTVQVQCELCQQEYRFDAAALASLFGPESGGTVH